MGKPIVEAEGEIEKCAWTAGWIADHAARLLCHNLHGGLYRGKGGQDALPVRLPVRRHRGGVLLVGGERHGLDGAAVTLLRIANAESFHRRGV